MWRRVAVRSLCSTMAVAEEGGARAADVRAAPPQLKYPMRHAMPAGTGPTGFAAPLGGTDHLPFRVARTRTGNLPVYSDFRAGGSRRVTVLRRFHGSGSELATEVRALLPGADVALHPGRVEVGGFHVRELKVWLMRLGF